MQKPKISVDFYSSQYYFSPHNGSAEMLAHCVAFCCVWEVHNYERYVYERKADLSPADQYGAAHGHLDAGQCNVQYCGQHICCEIG